MGLTEKNQKPVKKVTPLSYILSFSIGCVIGLFIMSSFPHVGKKIGVSHQLALMLTNMLLTFLTGVVWRLFVILSRGDKEVRAALSTYVWGVWGGTLSSIAFSFVVLFYIDFRSHMEHVVVLLCCIIFPVMTMYLGGWLINITFEDGL